MSHISVALRRRIRERSHGLCEYCLIGEEDTYFPHEPDHVIAQKHGGKTAAGNLALACFDCNRFKGTDIASIDPETKRLVPLFNPRTDAWNDHFETREGLILPLYPEWGNTTKPRVAEYSRRTLGIRSLFLKIP